MGHQSVLPILLFELEGIGNAPRDPLYDLEERIWSVPEMSCPFMIWRRWGIPRVFPGPRHWMCYIIRRCFFCVSFMLFVFVFAFCDVCFLQPCGHLLGKGWTLDSLVCDVFLSFFTFLLSPGVLGQVRYLIVSIPDHCLLSNCYLSWGTISKRFLLSRRYIPLILRYYFKYDCVRSKCKCI